MPGLKEASINEGLSRRKFIQGAAAAAAVGGFSSTLLAGCAQLNSEAPSGNEASTTEDTTEIKFVTCHTNCSGQCPANVHIRDNRVVHVEAARWPEGYEEYERLCIRGMSHVQNMYGPQRLQAPLRRVGERGSGEWEQITWDEAIDEIGTKWKSYLDEFGPMALARLTVGGNTGMVGKQSYARLFNAFGGSVMAAAMDNNCFVGMKNPLGSGIYWNGNEWHDAYNAKTLVLWGWDPTGSQPMFWNQILNQLDTGVKLVVIEPHYTIAASKADQWIPIRPGTDGALALALMSALIEENLVDKDFLLKSSVAPFLVKPDGAYLRESDLGVTIGEGETDRIAVFDTATNNVVVVDDAQSPDLYADTTATVGGASVPVTTAYNLLLRRLEEEGITVAKAAEITELDEQVIRGLARTIADSPCTIRVGYGLDHYYNGYYTVFAAMVVGILSGNLGKPGAACGDGLNTFGNFINYGYQFPMGFSLDTTVSKGIPLGFNWPAPDIEEIRETGQFKGVDMPLKALYIHDTNPVTCYAEADFWINAINSFEFVVCADQWMTPTAALADIVLPACHWFEMEDLTGFFNKSCFVTYTEKIADPLYESKPDYEIAQLIGTALGYGEYFQHTNGEIIEAMIDSDGAREQGITLETLREKHFIRQLPAGPTGDYIYGADGVYGTPTGRVEFYLEHPEPEDDHGQEWDREATRLPHWMEPLEVGKNNPLREKYPLQFDTLNNRYHLHSQWDKVTWLREMDPEPLLKLNPIDADARGIKKGDVVKVFNDRGYAVMKADLNPALHPGTVKATKGFPPDAYIEGNFQSLTCKEYEPFNQNQNFYDVVCEVEKV